MTAPGSLAGWMVVVGLPLALVGATWHQLVMRGVRPGILAFEFAGSGARMYDLLEAWGATDRARARRAVAVDHLLILGYVLLLTGLALLSVTVMRRAGDGAWAWSGVLLGWAAALLVVGAGAADMAENRALRHCLDAWRDPPTTGGVPASQAQRREVIADLGPSARTARSAARLKFTLLALVGLWLVAAGTVYLAL